MSRSYWVSVFAVVGWLTTCTFALAQTPSGQGVAGEGPSVEEGHQGQTGNGKNTPDNFAVPVRIVEDPDQAQSSRDRDEKAEQHDADDLEAQRKAADAADRSAAAAEWQEILTEIQIALSAIGIIGTIGFIASLILTYRATNAAVRATELAKLDHPSKFKFTRPIIYVGDSFTAVPKFSPGERIKGRIFAVNYGPYGVKLIETEPGKYKSDCWLYWHKTTTIPKTPSIPMWVAYQRTEANLSNSLKQVPDHPSLPDIAPHGYARWDIETTVPKGFKITRGRWSHMLFMIGSVDFKQFEIPRGDYLSKWYDPKEQRFKNCDDE